MDDVDDRPALDAVDEGNRLALVGRHREAITCFEQARDLGEMWVGLNIGNSHEALGDEAAAEREYRLSWLECDDQDAAFNLAALLDRRGSDEARDIYRHLIELGYAKASVNESCRVREEGDYDGAIFVVQGRMAEAASAIGIVAGYGVGRALVFVTKSATKSFSVQAAKIAKLPGRTTRLERAHVKTYVKRTRWSRAGISNMASMLATTGYLSAVGSRGSGASGRGARVAW